MSQRTFTIVGALVIALLPLAGRPARPATAGKPKPAPTPAAKAAQPKAPPPSSTPSPAPPAQGKGQPGGKGGVLAPNPSTGDIDEILQGEEEVLSGNSFSYDPGNRRDPFKSLLAGPERTEIRGPRPEGIPGLLIDEIDLKGIWRTGKGYVAQVVATNQK